MYYVNLIKQYYYFYLQRRMTLLENKYNIIKPMKKYQEMEKRVNQRLFSNVMWLV